MNGINCKTIILRSRFEGFRSIPIMKYRDVYWITFNVLEIYNKHLRRIWIETFWLSFSWCVSSSSFTNIIEENLNCIPLISNPDCLQWHPGNFWHASPSEIRFFGTNHHRTEKRKFANPGITICTEPHLELDGTVFIVVPHPNAATVSAWQQY